MILRHLYRIQMFSKIDQERKVAVDSSNDRQQKNLNKSTCKKLTFMYATNVYFVYKYNIFCNVYCCVLTVQSTYALHNFFEQ